MRFDIAVVGRTVWDEWVLSNNGGELIEPDASFGGSGANIAIHLARLGLKVTFVSSLGNDTPSHIYEERLKRLGIDLTFCAKSSQPLARCRIWPGKRYEWVNLDKGFPLLTAEVIAAAIETSNSVFFVDVAPLAGMNLASSAYWLPQLYLDVGERRPFTDCRWRAVFLNRKEADRVEQLFGKQLGGLSAMDSATTWFVTDEGRPTTVFRCGDETRFPVPFTGAVSSVGGGDAFAAAVCACDVLNRSVPEAIQLGHALAGAVVSQLGCQLSDSAHRELIENLHLRWLK